MQKILLCILPIVLASCDAPDDAELLDADEELAGADEELVGADEELADADGPVKTAPAELGAPEDAPTALWGCGLEKQKLSDGWAYTVVNCHPYAVTRRVMFNDGNPGACRYYGTSSYDNHFSGSAQREPVYLIGC
jgi:hypothetical protein